MTVTVFRSTDTNAPKLSGVAGSLTDVLLACLVNGYGSVFASGSITSNGTNVSNNDTVTVDNITYTFKTALTPAANEVLIGASAAASLTNLQAAINLQGTSGTTYGAATQTPQGAYSSNVTATVLTLAARKGGAGGNSIALARVAATLTVSGANLSGGSGSDTKASAGWSNPFNGNGGQRVFRPGSGVQNYFHVDDATPDLTALGKEGQFRGSEAATGFQNATNYFPTVAQFALGTGLVARKSATTGPTARSWIVIADDRTVYGFLNSGDFGPPGYMPFSFGEIYSLLASGTDLYRSVAKGRALVNSASANAGQQYLIRTTPNSNTGCYTARIYTGSGVSVQHYLTADNGLQGVNGSTPNGAIVGVDPCTGAIIMLPLRVMDLNVIAAVLRGRHRGIFGSAQAAATFGDGDLVTGSGAYAGRSFLAVAGVIDNATTIVVFIDITGPWETN